MLIARERVREISNLNQKKNDLLFSLKRVFEHTRFSLNSLKTKNAHFYYFFAHFFHYSLFIVCCLLFVVCYLFFIILFLICKIDSALKIKNDEPAKNAM
jgi:hypothetical protein